MNNMITYTDRSVFTETITHDRKQAKLSTSKMEQVRKVVSQSITAVKEKAVEQVIDSIKDKSDRIKMVVSELGFSLIPTNKEGMNGSIYTNGTRKLKVNPLIPDCIGKVRANCPVEVTLQKAEEKYENIDDIKEDNKISTVLETKNILPVENRKVVERSAIEQSVPYQAPLSRVNKIQPTINTTDANVPSVDAYLQRINRDGNESIETLEMDNQKLVEEINNKKSYLAQLEEELQKIEQEKRIKDLEEEKLGYTSTLQGLSDQIRRIQTEIEEKKQSYGR